MNLTRKTYNYLEVEYEVPSLYSIANIYKNIKWCRSQYRMQLNFVMYMLQLHNNKILIRKGFTYYLLDLKYNEIIEISYKKLPKWAKI